jgi:eukaryotic-like serine/threonine-protein kinase
MKSRGYPRLRLDLELGLLNHPANRVAIAKRHTLPRECCDPDLYVRVLTSLALARAGDSAAAETLITELERTFPPESMMMLYGSSSIHAALDLNRNDAIDAVNRSQAAAYVELSNQVWFTGSTMYPVFLRGLSYLASNKGQEAAVEFQKFVNHRGLIANCPLGALADLGLARAYVMQGDTAKAKTAYADFLTPGRTPTPTCPS